MKRFISFLLSLTMAVALHGETENKKPQNFIRLVGVRPTPEPETVSLFIAFPRNGGQAKSNPVWIQTRVEGYSLGTDSYFDRSYEIANSKMGQTLHVIIDDRPYFAVNESPIDPFKEQGNYYILSYKFEVPFSLDEGLHTIRAFPARSYGEALKGENTFAVSTFYIGNDQNTLGVDLSKPYLTYNEPGDQMQLVESKPVLLDFYLRNCELSPDGYKVRLTIDHSVVRTLTTWQPYYIYGLEKGKHTLKLELLNESNMVVRGPFNNVQRTITIR
jgi:hypothetical protein